MRLHCGGGRVVAWARRSLGGQAIGTEFCHRSCRGSHSLATRAHGIAMIISPPRGCLMPRLRQPAPLTRAALAAVDLPAVVERAEVDHEPAPRAGNPYENLDTIHARTPTAALIEVAPPVRLRAPSPGLRPRATRRLRALHLGLHLFRGHRSLRDGATTGHFSAEASMLRFLRISAIVKSLAPMSLVCSVQLPPELLLTRSAQHGLRA
jgi:hypothetical protein